MATPREAGWAANRTELGMQRSTSTPIRAPNCGNSDRVLRSSRCPRTEMDRVQELAAAPAPGPHGNGVPLSPNPLSRVDSMLGPAPRPLLKIVNDDQGGLPSRAVRMVESLLAAAVKPWADTWILAAEVVVDNTAGGDALRHSCVRYFDETAARHVSEVCHAVLADWKASDWKLRCGGATSDSDTEPSVSGLPAEHAVEWLPLAFSAAEDEGYNAFVSAVPYVACIPLWRQCSNDDGASSSVEHTRPPVEGWLRLLRTTLPPPDTEPVSWWHIDAVRMTVATIVEASLPALSVAPASPASLTSPPASMHEEGPQPTAVAVPEYEGIAVRPQSPVVESQLKWRVYLNKWRGASETPLAVASNTNCAIIFMGVFLTMMVVSVVNELLTSRTDDRYFVIIGSLGALMTLQFVVPNSPLAQPRNAVLGGLVSSSCGIVSFMLASDDYLGAIPLWVASALAPALGISCMAKLGLTHPPAGAAALIFVAGTSEITDLGFMYLLVPLTLGNVLCCVLAMAYNNLFTRRQYPIFW